MPELLQLIASLQHAADALESGRAAQLTAEWRVRLGAACRAGADLAREQLPAKFEAEEKSS